MAQDRRRGFHRIPQGPLGYKSSQSHCCITHACPWRSNPRNANSRPEHTVSRGSYKFGHWRSAPRSCNSGTRRPSDVRCVRCRSPVAELLAPKVGRYAPPSLRSRTRTRILYKYTVVGQLSPTQGAPTQPRAGSSARAAPRAGLQAGTFGGQCADVHGSILPQPLWKMWCTCREISVISCNQGLRTVVRHVGIPGSLLEPTTKALLRSSLVGWLTQGGVLGPTNVDGSRGRRQVV